MNATERQLQALLARMARNKRLLEGEGTPGERWQLQQSAAVPLVGMAFVAGLICGGGVPLQTLQVPLLRGALRTLYSIGEVGIDAFQ
ncbi:MAG TPA: hypothetical protein VNR18_02505 [Hyphomicrobiales bacterium]|nr:hypothetical protein [Hyphomicrobiales bacterium]